MLTPRRDHKSSPRDVPDTPPPSEYDAEGGYEFPKASDITSTSSKNMKLVSPPVNTSNQEVKEETGASDANDRKSSGSLRDPVETQVAKLKEECTQQAGLAYRLIEQISENLMSERYASYRSKFPSSTLRQVRAHVDAFLAAAASSDRVEVLKVALKSLRAEVEGLQEVIEITGA